MNNEETVQRSKSSTKKYLIYGLPNLSTSIIMGIADFALFTLYKLGYQLNAFYIGTALAIGKLTIAGSQFFFGWISDSKYTKWGRRKPYLIILSPILSIAFLFLLLPGLLIDINDLNAVFLWLLVWNIFFNLSYGVTSPYGSWMAEQFTVSERPKASQYYNIFSFTGSAIMSTFSIIVLTSTFKNISTSPDIIPSELLYSVIIFSILPILLFYVAAFLMPTEPHFKIKSTIFDNLKVILKNKNFILVNIMQGIASIAFIMIGQMILQFTLVVLQFENADFYIVAVLMMFGIPAFIYLWRKILQKFGKKKKFTIYLSCCNSFPSHYSIWSYSDGFVSYLWNIFCFWISSIYGGMELTPKHYLCGYR